uniref:Uncharacterized protein n=1 Tax=Geospiza parvula TaxID=87175 RepID=A0A8C3MUM6_GEOPR
SNYVTGTMTIHNEEQIVDVHVRSGIYSSDTIFDYTHGYIATRLFSRNACFIMKIKKEIIPDLQEIGRLAFEREVTVGNPVLGHLKDWILYGKHIENLCTGLPLYELVATEPPANDDGCASAGIPSILGLKICEELIANEY